MLSALWQRFLFWCASELGVRVVQSVLSCPEEWRPEHGYSVYHRENLQAKLRIEWAVNANHMPMVIEHAGNRLLPNRADKRLIRIAFKEAEATACQQRHQIAIEALRLQAERKSLRALPKPSTSQVWTIRTTS